VAGHSLGGVTACEFSKSNQNLIRGLVLLGSYCNGNATKLNIPVLSIFATNDGLTTTADIEKSRLTLPPNSVFVEVAGGNHTQFGSFAKLQPGDQPADVSEQAQAEQVSKAILNFINR
jgi:pimeloyl-ACP methyl ester carboxylesterase